MLNCPYHPNTPLNSPPELCPKKWGVELKQQQQPPPCRSVMAMNSNGTPTSLTTTKNSINKNPALDSLSKPIRNFGEVKYFGGGADLVYLWTTILEVAKRERERERERVRACGLERR
jgi:hypothetical protein